MYGVETLGEEEAGAPLDLAMCEESVSEVRDITQLYIYIYIYILKFAISRDIKFAISLRAQRRIQGCPSACACASVPVPDDTDVRR